MYEKDLIIFIKIDLTLNNLQMLICHKTQPINQQWTSNLIELLEIMFLFFYVALFM